MKPFNGKETKSKTPNSFITRFCTNVAAQPIAQPQVPVPVPSPSSPFCPLPKTPGRTRGRFKFQTLAPPFLQHPAALGLFIRRAASSSVFTLLHLSYCECRAIEFTFFYYLLLGVRTETYMAAQPACLRQCKLRHTCMRSLSRGNGEVPGISGSSLKRLAQPLHIRFIIAQLQASKSHGSGQLYLAK